jgi:hypothetical protein
MITALLAADSEIGSEEELLGTRYGLLVRLMPNASCASLWVRQACNPAIRNHATGEWLVLFSAKTNIYFSGHPRMKIESRNIHQSSC